MPRSDYVESIRRRIGNDLLLLPAVTAVIRDGDRFLLARDAQSSLWSLIGGGMRVMRAFVIFTILHSNTGNECFPAA